MADYSTIRFVVDTNVIFEGLTKQGSASGFLIDSWYAGLFQAYVTNALIYEYLDVLSRKLSPHRWSRLEPAIGTLLASARLVVVHYSWRPLSPDPGDDHLIDCAMNTGASVVTWNVKDFREARESVGLSVLTPLEAVTLLSNA